MCINLFRVFTIYLKPILPKLASDVQSFLNLEDQEMAWGETRQLVGCPIKPFQHLMTRVETKQIESLIEDNKQNLVTARKKPRRFKRRNPGAARNSRMVLRNRSALRSFKKLICASPGSSVLK